jgi:hypothetical protein
VISSRLGATCRGSLLAIGLAVVLAGSVASARQVLPPSAQAKVLRALGAFKPGADVTGGWSVGDVALAEDRVRVELLASSGRATVVLLPPDAPGPALATTRSFSVRLDAPTPSPAGLDAAVAAVVASLGANDPGGVWAVLEAAPTQDPRAPGDAAGPPGAAAPSPESPARTDLIDLRLWLVIVLAAAVAALLTDRTAFARAAGGPLPALELAALTALLAIAVAARELLGPMTFLHENAHGVFRLEQFAGLVAERRPMAGQTALQQLAAALTPPTIASVPHVTAALAALSAPLTALTARALGLRAPAALSAGLLLALLPLHIRISASEDAFPVAATFLTAATLAAAVAARARAPRWLIASLLFVALAGHFRPAMYAAALPLALAVPLCGGLPALRHALRAPATWLAPVAFLIAAADDIAAILTALGGPTPLTAGWWSAPSLRSWPLLDPAATPLWLPALAASGLALGLAAPRTRGAALWLATLLTALTFVYTSDNGWPAAIRYSVAYAFILPLAAALALDAALARRPALRLALPALVAALAATSLASRAPFVTHRYAQQRELDFQIAQVLPHLLSAPPGAIITPWPHLDGMQGTLLTTPLREAGYRIVDPTAAAPLLTAPATAPLYWYRGLACFARPIRDSAVTTVTAPACDAIEAQGPWEPVAELALPPDSDADWITLGDAVHPVHIGLYRRPAPR